MRQLISRICAHFRNVYFGQLNSGNEQNFTLLRTYIYSTKPFSGQTKGEDQAVSKQLYFTAFIDIARWKSFFKFLSVCVCVYVCVRDSIKQKNTAG